MAQKLRDLVNEELYGLCAAAGGDLMKVAGGLLLGDYDCQYGEGRGYELELDLDIPDGKDDP